jgi:hypothetical protein
LEDDGVLGPLRFSLTMVGVLSLALVVAVWAESTPSIPAESGSAAKLRHARVAERRAGINIICHRGASEHAHENTLEAYRATFELGGDGNEVDIRSTKDGVLVCFHDDMLDRLLQGYGDVADYNWSELQQLRFREPGRFGDQCRLPTLVEVLELHRKYAGLLHLDIKRPGLDPAIGDLLTRMDIWDHVAYLNMDNGGVLLRDPRLKLRRYKGPSLFSDRSEVFPEAIGRALNRPDDDVIVDDPRGVAVALGRKLGMLSTTPVMPRQTAATAHRNLPSEADLIARLHDDRGWDQIAGTADEKVKSAKHIVFRAKAADELFDMKASSQTAFDALEQRVRNRSLHREWLYHGLDGASALRSLILLRAPNAIDTARFALWRDDPALEPLVDPRWKNPRAFVDFRSKEVVFPALKRFPGPESEKLCRDYLALSDDQAGRIGPAQFEEAAKTLLTVSPNKETAIELMQHRLQIVRGRTILECVGRAGEPWANAVLREYTPYALAYQVKYEYDGAK